MHVAFLVNNYPPRVGGVEGHVASLARALVSSGDRVTVVTLGDRPGHREVAGVEVITLRERLRIADVLGVPGLGTRRRLTTLLRERGVDIVSLHTRFFPMSFLGFRAARRAAVPTILTEHGSDHVASTSALIWLGSRLVDATFGRAVLRGVDRVLGISGESVEFVRRLAGVDAQVFHNAVPDSLMHADRLERVQRPAHLVFVGRVVPGKGWVDYLEAMAALRSRGHAVTGEVLGDGVDLPRLRRRIRHLDLGDVVEVCGRVSGDRVIESLKDATLVNPSRLAEGFQTTLLESIAVGGQVVTYPVAGASTLSAEGAPVLTCQPNSAALAEAIASVVKTPLAPSTPEWMAGWSWSARCREFRRICEGALRAR